MLIKTNTIGKIHEIILDNIFIKDKTIVIIINNKILIRMILEDILKDIKEKNLNDTENIKIRKSSSVCEIGNFLIIGCIDGSLIKGIKAKNIIVYNYEQLNKEDVDNIIIGTMRY